jgi:hypothetical protein
MRASIWIRTRIEINQRCEAALWTYYFQASYEPYSCRLSAKEINMVSACKCCAIP